MPTQTANPIHSHPLPTAPAKAGARVGGGVVVIIGGSIAGVLAAWALRDFADQIIVIERDRYSSEPVWGSGVPQARHAHLVLEAGHRALEQMMPGVRDELLAAGATMVSMGRDLRWLTSAGWMARHDSSSCAFLSVTRPLLDHIVRQRVYAHPAISFREGTDVVGLLGTAHEVSGVQIRARGTAEVESLHAEMVVDASGRSSAMPGWLRALGCAPVPEQRIDAGVAYVSRLFHRRADADLDGTAIYLQTAGPDHPHMASLLPVEDDKWLVSVGGMRGSEPASGADGFVAALHHLRDPAISQALDGAEPAGPVWGARPGASVRRNYGHRHAPHGLVVIGDAAASFNPVYGQGISVAALGALALRRAADTHKGVGHRTARDARRRIYRTSREAWLMSATEDARFHTTIGSSSSPLIRGVHRVLNRLLAAATKDPRATAAFQETMSLVAKPTRLMRPSVLGSILRGDR